MPTYEDVDEKFEYLDLAGRNIGVVGIKGKYRFITVNIIP